MSNLLIALNQNQLYLEFPDANVECTLFFSVANRVPLLKADVLFLFEGNCMSSLCNE